MAEWVEIGLVAQELGRSLHTVNGWAKKGRGGVRLGKRRQGSRYKGRVLVDMEVARVMNLEAPRVRVSRVSEDGGEKPGRIYRLDVIKESDGGGEWDHHDTWAKVVADRKGWVRGWVERGLSLRRVLSIFNPRLHSEIRAYYHRAKMGKL